MFDFLRVYGVGFVIFGICLWNDWLDHPPKCKKDILIQMLYCMLWPITLMVAGFYGIIIMFLWFMALPWNEKK